MSAASTTSGVDRTPKTCPHPRADHQHGTALAYDKDACRCLPCVSAASSAGRVERYRTATGTSSYVPATAARAHVNELLEVLTVSQVEQRSGVHRTAIRVLVGDFPGRPASKRITRSTEAALLAVSIDRLGPEASGLVDGTGTRRRFRALIASGWPASHLGSRLGFSSRTNWFLTAAAVDDASPVRTSTRDAVRRLYDELSLTLPSPSRAATRARNIAAARGWPSSWAWDDDAIDDPASDPTTEPAANTENDVDELALELVLDGQPMHLSDRELEIAIEQLSDRGLTATAIAARCRSDETTVRRLRNTIQQRNTRAAAKEQVA